MALSVVFFGTSAFGIPALDALKRSSHMLLHVVTTPAKPQGRQLKTIASPVFEWAKAHAVPVTELADLKSEDIVKFLKGLNADVFVTASFGLMLPKNILDIPKRAALNIHPSLLPKYRGAAPIHWALLNGDKKTGVCLIRMSSKLDAGDIALVKEYPLAPDESIFSAEEDLSRLGAALLMDGLTQLEKKALVFVPQNEAESTYARKLTKEDGRIDWKRSAQSVQAQVRALLDWPTSFTFFEGKRIVIWACTAGLEAPVNASPGQVLGASSKTGLTVACAASTLEISELQLEGRKRMNVRDFLSGFGIKTGAFFE